MNHDIKILVAAHKKAEMPKEPIYYPIYVGAFGKGDVGFQRDDLDDNISEKNPYYCELTGVYWAWKNLDCDIIGLVHYRRLFGNKSGLNKKDIFKNILTPQMILRLMNKYDIVLAKPRNYYIENIRTHFHNHLKVFTNIDYIAFLEKTIKEECPEYMDAYLKCMERTRAHMCNMFIMKRNEFNNYCDWLFHLLETMELKHSEFTSEPPMPRIYGFIGELMLDVYVTKNNLNYYEQEVIEIDTQSSILKAFNFCKRKFLGIK